MYFGHNEIDDEEEVKKTSWIVNLLQNKKLLMWIGIVLGVIILLLIIILLLNNKESKVSYTLELVGDTEINIALKDQYIELGYMAYDSNDNNVSSYVSVDGAVNSLAEGTYTITYSLVIDNEEVASATRVVNVVSTSSVLTLLLKGDKNITVSKKNIFVEPGYSAADSVEGDLNDKVKTFSNIDYSKTGVYTVIYYVKNSNNITKATYRTITITE